MFDFEKSKNSEKIGGAIGYVFAYVVFTSVLFFVFFLLGRIPESWNYLYFMAITLILVIVGNGVRGVLE